MARQQRFAVEHGKAGWDIWDRQSNERAATYLRRSDARFFAGSLSRRFTTTGDGGVPRDWPDVSRSDIVEQITWATRHGA